MKTLQTAKACCTLVALVACCAAGAPASAALHSYTGLYAFGDSLSDSGNAYAVTLGLVPGSPYFEGRFSSGYTFVDQLSLRLFGSPSVPVLANPGTGTNFAVGGARTDFDNNAVPSPTGMRSQYALYDQVVDQGDSSALYVVYGGANDMFGLFGSLSPNPAEWGAARQAVVTSAIDNLSFIISGLADHGAVHFLIPNLPDMGAIPNLRNGPLSTFATETSQQFNVALGALVDEFSGTGLDLRGLDVFSLFDEVLATPAAFGFANATDACYQGTIFGGARTDTCADPDQYVFWDDVHPTGHAHMRLGDAAWATVVAVPEPETSVLLVFGLVALMYVVRARSRVALTRR